MRESKELMIMKRDHAAKLYASKVIGFKDLVE
jgi:hypothetical protein